MPGKIDAPLDKRLKKVKWGNYKAEDLFGIQKITCMLSKNDLQENGKYPVYSSESVNNGIIGYTNHPEFICDDKTPIYITMGDHTRSFNIAKESFSVLDNVKVLVPCTNSIRSLLFMVSIWKKQIPNMGYARHWKYAKRCVLQLPQTESGEINFDFMEIFVRELEKKHICELRNYLKANNLDNCELSNSERSIINCFDQLRWKSFRLGDLFDHIVQGKRLKKEDQKKGDIPFVMAGISNAGVANYVSNPVAVFPSNSITVDIFGNTFYRSFSFGAGDDTGVYWNIKQKYTKKQMLFMTAAIDKALRGRFSFSKKLRSSQSLDFKIFLPSTASGSPDFIAMEAFVSAIEKLVIKGISDYTTRRIETTKKVIQ